MLHFVRDFFVSLKWDGKALIDQRILGEQLRERKVAVWNSLESTWQPIPVALTPTTVSSKDWAALEADARAVFSTFPRVLAWLQKSDQCQLREKLFSGLSNFEARYFNQDPDLTWGHVTTSMDLYWHQSQIKIIEVNCTIPAMQSYSDNVLSAWQAAGGQVQNTPSNADELLESLMAMYRLDGGLVARPRIIILHRDGDSQLGELIWLQRKWSDQGYVTVLATPNQLTRVGDLWVVDDLPCDLVYRHVFAWRLADLPIAEFLENNRKSHIYNPVSAHYEAKAFLALTSHIAGDEILAKQVELTSKEVEAINRRVPWSRVLGSTFTGVSFDSITSRLSSLVLKRSVGFGGHHVIMGDEWDTPLTQARLGELTGKSVRVDFNSFADWAQHKDNSLWIAQERMSGARRKTEVLTARGIEQWDAWYDASIFINTRTPPICRGGVSRIAQSPVVNIGTGGGLAPFVIEP